MEELLLFLAGLFEGGFGFGVEFVHIGFYLTLGLAGHAVDEKDAIEMVRLVLDGTGEQAATAELETFALRVRRAFAVESSVRRTPTST